MMYNIKMFYKDPNDATGKETEILIEDVSGFEDIKVRVQMIMSTCQPGPNGEKAQVSYFVDEKTGTKYSPMDLPKIFGAQPNMVQSSPQNTNVPQQVKPTVNKYKKFSVAGEKFRIDVSTGNIQTYDWVEVEKPKKYGLKDSNGDIIPFTENLYMKDWIDTEDNSEDDE